jgi:hypothetical protein
VGCRGFYAACSIVFLFVEESGVKRAVFSFRVKPEPLKSGYSKTTVKTLCAILLKKPHRRLVRYKR